ncbi:MAG: hypothetical protein KC443_13380 [Anaerolineales bacterium]|nr:hypothetical protein [Anaerolineales bacterium]
MTRDYFVTMVYCLVCTHYQVIVNQQPLRRRGFLPTLTDEEVITIEICGEYFGFSQEDNLYNYFFVHYAHFFPALQERTSFVRQCANLWKMKALIQERLTYVSGEAHDPVQIIDTMGSPTPLQSDCQKHDRLLHNLLSNHNRQIKLVIYYKC